MFEFEKPRIEIAELSEDGMYGRFVVEPLERGYGNYTWQRLEKDSTFFSSGCCG